MDLLSHACLGAAIGGAIGHRARRRAMLWGAVAGLLPDLDTLGGLVLSEAQQLSFHRGVTHSLLALVLVPPLLAWLLHRRSPDPAMPYARWLLLLFLAQASHLFLDLLTCYGTGLLEPFSDARYSLNAIFVADPLYTLPLLGFLVASFWGRHPLRRVLIGLGVSFGYLVFALGIHAGMVARMQHHLRLAGLPHHALTVTPTPMNTLLWMGLSQDSTGIWVGFGSLFDAGRRTRFHFLPRHEELRIAGDPALPLLEQFAQGNHVFTRDSAGTYFHDMRFGFVEDWDSLGSRFALTYRLGSDGADGNPLNRGRFSRPVTEVAARLLQRIGGG